MTVSTSPGGADGTDPATIRTSPRLLPILSWPRPPMAPRKLAPGAISGGWKLKRVAPVKTASGCNQSCDFILTPHETASQLPVLAGSGSGSPSRGFTAGKARYASNERGSGFLPLGLPSFRLRSMLRPASVGRLSLAACGNRCRAISHRQAAPFWSCFLSQFQAGRPPRYRMRVVVLFSGLAFRMASAAASISLRVVMVMGGHPILRNRLGRAVPNRNVRGGRKIKDNQKMSE